MKTSKHLTLHQEQRNVVLDPARYKVIRAGRKAGKTSLEVEIMVYKSVAKQSDLGTDIDNRKILYIAPTQVQARKIVWNALKSRIEGIGKPNEQRLELKIPTADGDYSIIYVGGWENRESHRGLTGVYHIIFDELDSMRDFFVGWQEIYRPLLLDTGGTADFIGTPKKENPNLRRLEKEFEGKGESFATFHFPTMANPHISKDELKAIQEDMDADTYRQEILAEYIENVGSLFRYAALVDMFTNTVTKSNEKFLTVDVAGDGSDKIIFTFWNGLEAYRVEVFERLNTEGIINQIKEYAASERIPYSNIAVDSIGVGEGVGSSSHLDGIVAYKGSHQPIKTDKSPVVLPNVHYRNEAPLISDFRNLRSQCAFKLSNLVNNHLIACRAEDVRIKERIIEELFAHQDASKGDGKRQVTPKEDLKEILGHSPDFADTFIMRMYFEIRGALIPGAVEAAEIAEEMQAQFTRTEKEQSKNRST